MQGCAACVKQYDLNVRRCSNRLACATAAGNAVRLPWCRPRHQRRRFPAPIAGTVRTPGTFGISAWLLRSEANRQLRCREERTGRDPRRGRRRSHASPYPRGLAAAGEGPGSRYSSGHATFPPRGPRRGSCVVAPWLPRISRGRAPAITANAYLCPRLPVPAAPLLAATRPCRCAAVPLRGRAVARPCRCAAVPLRGRAVARPCRCAAVPLRGRAVARPCRCAPCRCAAASFRGRVGSHREAAETAMAREERPLAAGRRSGRVAEDLADAPR